MAARKKTGRKASASRRTDKRGAASGRLEHRGARRNHPFDPSRVFRFDETRDGLEHILCSDGFTGEFAQSLNQTCCEIWRRLEKLPDSKLGRAMLKVLEATGNGGCLSTAEKQLIRDWPPYQLRYAAASVVHACAEHDLIDPHLGKLKTLPGMPPALWVWTRPYGAGDPWGKGGCGVFIVFLHPDFELSLPDDCSDHPSAAERGAPVLDDSARRRPRS